MIFLQASCLFGVGPDKIILLDSKTKALIRQLPRQDLQQWNADSSRALHAGVTGSDGEKSPFVINLEFRGTKPWRLMVQSAERFRLLMSALCEVIQVDLHKFQLGKIAGMINFLANSFQRRLENSTTA